MTGIRIPRVYEPHEVRVQAIVNIDGDIVLLGFGRPRQEVVPLIGIVNTYDDHIRLTRDAARRLRDALIKEVGSGTDDARIDDYTGQKICGHDGTDPESDFCDE